MSSNSRGSGPDRRGSRRQRVAGSRGRPQSRAQTPESQTPESQEPAEQELGEQETSSVARATESGQRAPGGSEPGGTEVAAAPSDAGNADVGEAEAPGSGAAEPDTSGADSTGSGSDSASAGSPSTERIAQLPADGDGAQGEDASEDAADGPAAGGGTAEDAESAQRGSFRLRVGLLAAAAVLAGFGAWFAYETVAVHTSGAAANEALVDAGVTSEVNGQVGDAVTKLFSYNFAEDAKADAAADELLVGPAVAKYNELWGVLREQAPQQKLVVDTAVKSSAVTWLQGDRAEVLLYVDQKATRAGNEPQNEPAQLTVGAEKHGDTWKINRISLR